MSAQSNPTYALPLADREAAVKVQNAAAFLGDAANILERQYGKGSPEAEAVLRIFDEAHAAADALLTPR